MFPLCFRLCQKGKEYKINSWIFFIPNFGIFIPKFPLSLPSSTDNSPGDRGLCLSPCSRGMWSKMWVLGWESGKGHSTLALQQSQITSPLATDILSLVYTVPQRSIQSYFIYTRQPWLVSLGEGHFIHKNASFSFLKKKKKEKKNCSTMVISIQRKKKTSGVYCPVTKKKKKKKKWEALIHTYIPTNLVFCFHTCSVLAFQHPTCLLDKKASFTEHKFCCQGCFKTVIFFSKKASVSTF